MTGKTNIDELYLEKFDKVELWTRTLERAALNGRLRADAIPILEKMYASQCKIVDNEITLLGLPLADAADQIIERMPLVQPPRDDPAIAERERIEQEALQGSLAGHGAMFRRFTAQAGGDERQGEIAYNEWCAKNKAKPGKKADAAPVNGELAAADLKVAGGDNPFSAAGWSKTRAGALYRADPALCARLSKAAGFPSLDAAFAATKPRAAA